MQKIAIFCEGQTELILLREMLLRKYRYEINVDCWCLFTDNGCFTAPYPYSSPVAKKHYHIYNVGNDNAVLSRLLKREKWLWNEGFEKIVALRDMYSKAYRDCSSNIDDVTIEKFISNIAHTISSMAHAPDKIFFCHGIMETEAWFLALPECFSYLDEKLTVKYILDELGIDLDAVDPEKTIFHPASVVDKIYNLVGRSYDKSRDDIEAIASSLDLLDYESLELSGKCASFKRIYGYV